jgi:histone arginine demethylase JMJD6
MTHSWLTQVYGKKRVWMISPQQGEFVYQSGDEADISEVNSVKAPDLERYPLFAKTKILTSVLHPGETLFIPAGWWHTTECLTTVVSVSGNFVNGSNYNDFQKSVGDSLLGDPRAARRLWNQGLLRLHGIIWQIHHAIPKTREMRL